MKKSITLFAILIGAIVTIIFSCTRRSVPVPASSCIQIALSSAAGTTSQTVAVNAPITPISYTVTGSVIGDTAAVDTIGVSVLGTLPPGVRGIFSGGVFTISGSPTTSVGSPFTYTVTTTGSSCNNMAITGSITVTNCSTISLSSATVTTSQTATINNPITPITYTLGGGATGESVIGMPAGVTGTLVGSVLTISGTPTSSAGSPYTYTVTTTGGTCTSIATGTITVRPLSTSTIALTSGSSTQTISNGSAIGAIVYVVGGGATGAVLTGAPAGVTGTLVGSSFTISGTPTVSGVFVYTVTTTGGSGTATTTGTITVNPVSTSTITLTSGSSTQTISNGSAIGAIVYVVGGGATGAVLTGAPAGVTGTLVGPSFTISGTPTVSGVFVYTVTTTGGSGTATTTGTITVNPVSTSTITLTSGNPTPTVSSGVAITPIVYTVGGGVTGATLTGSLPAGITGVFGGATFTISGTPTVSGIFTYTVTTTGAGAVTATGAITVTSASLIVRCGITTSISQQFTWPPVTGATSYSISYTINGGAPVIASTTACSFTVNDNAGDVVVMTVTPIGTGSITPSTSACTAPI